jgi:ABC-type branched-subunit amino acid transport system substrate-binding protein
VTGRDINGGIPEGAPSVKVGICLDFPIEDVKQPFLDATRLAFDEATASGTIDRPVRLIIKDVEGLPRGDAHDVVLAWQDLADAGCVGIIGPLISDNSLAVKEHMANASRKVPTLTWSGTDRQYDEYMFGFGNGSLPEEGYLIAEAIADRGLKTVGVVYERAATGLEYTEFFTDACRREGLEIVHSEGVGQADRDLAKTVARLQARNPDAVAYFGFGLPGIEMNLAFHAADYNPPRYMCTAFINCYVIPEWMKGLQGWIGVDQYDEANKTGQALQERFEARFGYRQDNCVPTLAFDGADALARGIGHAQTLTPFGVMKGLEKVKAVPSCTGGPGTRISLGQYNRRAWHGVNYLVLREINEDASATRLVARFRS